MAGLWRDSHEESDEAHSLRLKLRLASLRRSFLPLHAVPWPVWPLPGPFGKQVVHALAGRPYLVDDPERSELVQITEVVMGFVVPIVPRVTSSYGIRAIEGGVLLQRISVSPCRVGAKRLVGAERRRPEAVATKSPAVQPAGGQRSL